MCARTGGVSTADAAAAASLIISRIIHIAVWTCGRAQRPGNWCCCTRCPSRCTCTFRTFPRSWRRHSISAGNIVTFAAADAAAVTASTNAAVQSNFWCCIVTNASVRIAFRESVGWVMSVTPMYVLYYLKNVIYECAENCERMSQRILFWVEE